MSLDERTDALVNGALIAMGALAVIDNIVVHWILHLHRAVPGAHATSVEFGLIALGIVLLIVGGWRETRARRKLRAARASSIFDADTEQFVDEGA